MYTTRSRDGPHNGVCSRQVRHGQVATCPKHTPGFHSRARAATAVPMLATSHVYVNHNHKLESPTARKS